MFSWLTIAHFHRMQHNVSTLNLFGPSKKQKLEAKVESFCSIKSFRSKIASDQKENVPNHAQIYFKFSFWVVECYQNRTRSK